MSSHMPLSGHDGVILFNDVAYDAESTQIENYVIIASTTSETMSELINRMPDIKFARQCFENAC